MSESKKSFRIDSEQKRDGYRAYDVPVFWSEKERIEKVSVFPEVNSMILKYRDKNMRVFADKGPKAYVIIDQESKDELDDAEQAMKFQGEVDPRMEQVVGLLLQVLSQEDSKTLDNFFSGLKTIRLNIAVDSLPPMDFARQTFSKLGDQQQDNYYERKFWAKSFFQSAGGNFLLDAILKSPLFEKLKSAREKQYGVEWANQIWLTVKKCRIDLEKVTLELSFNKPDLKKSKDAIVKVGEIYLVDTSKSFSSALEYLVEAYSKGAKICPLQIKGDGFESIKILLHEIKRLADLNTEESNRQALALQSTLRFYLPCSYKEKQIESRTFEQKVEWIIEGEKVEQQVKIEGEGYILSKYGTVISKKIEQDGITFLLTDLRKGAGVAECVFYVIKDGILYPRLAYKSRSHKRWRINTFNSGISHRGKGVFSYTTETVPFIELDDALESLEKGSFISEECVEEVLFFDDKSIHTYEDEVEKDLPVLYDFAAFTTNHFPHNPKAVDDLMNPDYIPDGFIPDFSSVPLEVRHREEVTIEHYHHTFRGIELDFHMVRDEDGRVWVDRLEKTLQPGDLTSYGTRKKSLEFGPLSMKPFDYAQQVAALNPDDEVYISSHQAHLNGVIKPNPSRPIQAIHNKDTKYADITPFFDQLKLIQRYREQKQFFRK